MHGRLRVLELFCGIGGAAVALGDDADVVNAMDINRNALRVYAANCAGACEARTIESVSTAELAACDADLWWLSPPCQPHTQRGHRNDVDDVRSEPLRAVLRQIREIQPRFVALENVPNFQHSRAYDELHETLAACGYSTDEVQLCPTQLGIPNRRRRFYLTASRGGPIQIPAIERRARRFSIRSRLSRVVESEWMVAKDVLERYRRALHIVDPEDASATCNCFTSGYGRSIVRSGSYLQVRSGVRRFSPREILRLLGFPESFRMPAALTVKQQWPLVGNSVSIPAVRWVLSPILAAHDASETTGVKR